MFSSGVTNFFVNIFALLIGDGDTKHIGFKVQMPSAFEIASVSFLS